MRTLIAFLAACTLLAAADTKLGKPLTAKETVTIAGICAMNIIWENLAEVRSLYVEEGYRNRGIGRNLVEACISEAITLQLYRVFTLTYKKDFFVHLGFKEVERSSLSEKIFSDCFRCSKYPDYCDEVAMVIDL